MSIQLIVYPQSFDGIPNDISGGFGQVVANPTNFSAVTTATSVSLGTSVNIPQQAIDSIQPTIIPNTWSYGYGTGGAPTNGATTGIPIFAYSALLQNLGNLVVNGVYDLDILCALSAGSVATVSVFNGTVLTSQTSIVPAALLVSTQFTAPSVNGTTIVISYENWLGVEIVQSVHVNLATAQPSGAIQNLENGQVICDLYEDEDIPLSLSVDDFKNVAEKVQSYSKAFNLPATKRNNKIFDNIFEITRSDDGIIFNPYKKTQCVLKQDGFILFEGYLRMLDITDKEGEVSFNVNLYSEVIALADLLGDRAFRGLDFTELTHTYNKTEIKNSWNDSGTGITYTNPSTSGFRDANKTVKYPFVNWVGDLPLAPIGSSANANNVMLPSLEAAFRPFINIKYIIDRIFEATPFTYESAFFNTTDFNKLYMDFNWGADNTPSNVSGSTYVGQAPYAATIYLLPFATSTFANLQLGNYQNNFNVTPPNYDQSTNILTATQTNETYAISYEYTCNPGSNNIYFQWLHTNAAGVPYPAIDAVTNPTTASGFITYLGSFTVVMQIGDTLEAQFSSDGIAAYQYSSFLSTVNFIKSISAVTSQTFLQTLRGETGQWDFLKGLITMFNLVTLVDENNSNNILIEPYADVFINSTDSVQLNWTDKIDVSEMKLTPLTDLNRKTLFKFIEDDDDYAFNQYKNQVGGHLYGSKKFPSAPDDRFNILKGTDEIVAEPFGATVVKPLMDNFSSFITPAIYSMNEDGTSEGFDNSPRIMYNNGIKNTGVSYYIPEQNQVGDENENKFLQFSHLSDVPTITGTRDFNFGECQLFPGLGNPVPNNLFGLYWLPYYSELYNPNTRIMTIKVNLTPSDINTFKFNDTVYLKNRVFRVNKIEYKPNDLATVEFILI